MMKKVTESKSEIAEILKKMAEMGALSPPATASSSARAGAADRERCSPDGVGSMGVDAQQKEATRKGSISPRSARTSASSRSAQLADPEAEPAVATL
eukprot:5970518-Pyramimonas_sp.AAC.1